MDQRRAEAAVRELLLALDRNVESEGLRETPRRVAEMMIEQCTPKDAEINVDFTQDHFGGMVIVRDIPFVSMCEHHLVFYTGRAHIGYIPKGKVLGISKLARLVYSCSVGLTTQEEVTAKIANELCNNSEVAVLGCAVTLIGEHGCMNLRGARAIGSSTVTTEVKGLLHEVPIARQEYLAFLSMGKVQ